MLMGLHQNIQTAQCAIPQRLGSHRRKTQKRFWSARLAQCNCFQFYVATSLILFSLTLIFRRDKMFTFNPLEWFNRGTTSRLEQRVITNTTTFPVSYILSQPYASNIIVSEKLKLMYCPIPKVTSSNWKYLIRKLEGHTDFADLQAAHNPNTSHLRYLSDYSPLEVQRLLQPGMLFKFAFVRDPYARLLSAYMDKLRRGTGSEYQAFVAAAFSWRVARAAIQSESDSDDSNNHNGGVESVSISQNMNAEQNNKTSNHVTRPSFRSFVRSISQLHPYAMDLHWRPQTHLCGFGVVPYDFVGHMERLEKDVITVLHRIGFPNETFPSHDMLAFPPSGASERLADQLYTTDLMFAVRAFYRRDFELLGYE